MKKFIRIFVCFIFAFSLFTQNVYASAVGTSYNVSLVVDRLSNSNSPFTVDAILSYSPSGGSSSYDYRSVSYSWNDHLTLRWKNLDSVTAVPNGYYSVSCRLAYRMDIKINGTVPLWSSPSSYSPLFSVSGLPSGASFQVISYQSVTSPSPKDTYSFVLTIDLRGTMYLSNARTSTFDLDFSIVDEYLLSSNENVPSLIITPTVTPTNFSSIITLSSVSESSDALLQDITNAVDRVDDTMKKEHQEEIDKAEETSGSVTSSSDKLTGTLSAWEIFTMPFQLVKDFATAIAGDGSTSFTFPSFSMMGYQIWPSYSFDLSSIKTNFPVLYNGVHAVSGILVVNGFIHYCWRKWAILMGDDLPEDTGGDV